MVLFFIFFTGCALVEQTPVAEVNKNATVPEELMDIEERVEIEPEALTKDESTIFSNGFIKGVIDSVYWSEESGFWHYEVIGNDTTNGKLPNANFTHIAKEFEKGTLIYAHIEDGKLLEMYKIGVAKLSKSIKAVPKQVFEEKNENLKKRTKERQKIAPPEYESIVLE